MLEVFFIKKINLTCSVTQDNDLVTTTIHHKAIKKININDRVVKTSQLLSSCRGEVFSNFIRLVRA